MRYEVRYIVDSDEQSTIVDADTAAEAADAVKDQSGAPGVSFELIQVQLLDEPTPQVEQGAFEQA